MKSHIKTKFVSSQNIETSIKELFLKWSFLIYFWISLMSCLIFYIVAHILMLQKVIFRKSESLGTRLNATVCLFVLVLEAPALVVVMFWLFRFWPGYPESLHLCYCDEVRRLSATWTLKLIKELLPHFTDYCVKLLYLST